MFHKNLLVIIKINHSSENPTLATFREIYSRGNTSRHVTRTDLGDDTLHGSADRRRVLGLGSHGDLRDKSLVASAERMDDVDSPNSARKGLSPAVDKKKSIGQSDADADAGQPIEKWRGRRTPAINTVRQRATPNSRHSPRCRSLLLMSRGLVLPP